MEGIYKQDWHIHSTASYDGFTGLEELIKRTTEYGITQSFHEEFAAALLENNKCAELNLSFYYSPLYTESFKHQYTQYIRSLFEKGVPITIGSDSHGDYGGKMGKYWYFGEQSERYIRTAGFVAEDFSAPKFRTYP